MSENRNKNLFGHSRWQIILSLRKSALGVRALAEELGVTDNAVRPHLSILERDGLIRQQGVKLSGGQPSHIFELTSAAEDLFPKAYGMLLKYILSEFHLTHDDQELHKLLVATGKKLAKNWPVAKGEVYERIEAGVNTLNEIGGLAEYYELDGKKYIKGYSCPLADATGEFPQVCDMALVLLEELTGLHLEKCCSYDDKPKCCFQVA